MSCFSITLIKCLLCSQKHCRHHCKCCCVSNSLLSIPKQIQNTLPFKIFLRQIWNTLPFNIVNHPKTNTKYSPVKDFVYFKANRKYFPIQHCYPSQDKYKILLASLSNPSRRSSIRWLVLSSHHPQFQEKQKSSHQIFQTRIWYCPFCAFLRFNFLL